LDSFIGNHQDINEPLKTHTYLFRKEHLEALFKD
jgi:hypothetical protein